MQIIMLLTKNHNKITWCDETENISPKTNNNKFIYTQEWKVKAVIR